MGRQFYKISGNPESKYDKKIRFQVEERFHERSIEKNPHPGFLDYEKAISEFDFSWVNGSIVSLYRKIGMANEFKEDIKGTGNVLIDNQAQEVANHVPGANIIRLNPLRVESKIQKAVSYGLSKEEAEKLTMVRVLIHEMVHAYSQVKIFGMETLRLNKKGNIEAQTGLERSTYGAKKKNEQISLHSAEYKELNEGVVDSVAEDIFERYTESKGLADTEFLKGFNCFLTKILILM